MEHCLHWRDLLRLQLNFGVIYQRDMEMESIPLMELLYLVEDIHVKTRHQKILTLTGRNF